jgi:hypothetical protein
VIRKILPALLLFSAVWTANKPATKTFKGAWFDIRYPAEFKAQPSLESSGVPGKFDSAYFSSQDKSVRFYIFSPQWGGLNPDINLNPLTEKLAAEETKKSAGLNQKSYTIVPTKSGYTRSYVETTNEDATVRWVVGIEYASEAAYKRHRKAYLAFKASLRQFAD